MSKVRWSSTLPKVCDLCGRKLEKEFIDGRLMSGPWAIMCLSCFKDVGVGLGLGRGQRYSIKGVKLE